MSVARRQESSASLTDYKDTWGAETSPLGTSFISIFLVLETKGNEELPSLENSDSSRQRVHLFKKGRKKNATDE